MEPGGKPNTMRPDARATRYVTDDGGGCGPACATPASGPKGCTLSHGHSGWPTNPARGCSYLETPGTTPSEMHFGWASVLLLGALDRHLRKRVCPRPPSTLCA